MKKKKLTQRERAKRMAFNVYPSFLLAIQSVPPQDAARILSESAAYATVRAIDGAYERGKKGLPL